jgi:hypothetical protein
LAGNVNEILENFDFTDSIITDIKWTNNLLDLVIIVDYYWDIQEGREETRLLKIIFKNCVKADFKINKKVLPYSEISTVSFFTIILFKENAESDFLNEYSTNKQQHLEIYTTDYSTPWLSVLCSEVTLEEQ